jgi:hypothetical protein
MAVLVGGGFRSDDLAEAELGDVMHFPECIDVLVFCSNTDPASMSQPALLQQSSDATSGAASLVQSAAAGLQHLLDQEERLLRMLGASLSASLSQQDRAGPEALATWPAPVPASRPASSPWAYLPMSSPSMASGCLTTCPNDRTSASSPPRQSLDDWSRLHWQPPTCPRTRLGPTAFAAAGLRSSYTMVQSLARSPMC